VLRTAYCWLKYVWSVDAESYLKEQRQKAFCYCNDRYITTLHDRLEFSPNTGENLFQFWTQGQVNPDLNSFLSQEPANYDFNSILTLVRIYFSSEHKGRLILTWIHSYHRSQLIMTRIQSYHKGRQILIHSYRLKICFDIASWSVCICKYLLEVID
jgi:hypothetical protein